ASCYRQNPRSRTNRRARQVQVLALSATCITLAGELCQPDGQPVLQPPERIFAKSPPGLRVAQRARRAPSQAPPPYREPRETQAPQHSDTPAVTKPRRERTRKPTAPPPPAWKLEDFVVEPAEGKTRFHDFKLSPELMHAIQDLGFPY